jgi:hypothetical protein
MLTYFSRGIAGAALLFTLDEIETSLEVDILCDLSNEKLNYTVKESDRVQIVQKN